MGTRAKRFRSRYKANESRVYYNRRQWRGVVGLHDLVRSFIPANYLHPHTLVVPAMRKRRVGMRWRIARCGGGVRGSYLRPWKYGVRVDGHCEIGWRFHFKFMNLANTEGGSSIVNQSERKLEVVRKRACWRLMVPWPIPQ